MSGIIGGAGSRSGVIDLISQNIALSSGKGIDFGASSNVAGMTGEVLTDYEEGTWTPVLSDATTGGNTATLNASYDLGRYVKVGNQVTLTGLIGSTSITGMNTGNGMYIQGLPFTVASGNEGYVGSTFGYGYGLATGTAGYNVGCYAQNGASYAMFTYWAATGGTDTFTVAMWTADGRVMFNLTYISA